MDDDNEYTNRDLEPMLEDDEYDSYYVNDADSLLKKPKVLALTKDELAGEFPCRAEYIVTDTVAYLNTASMFVILFSSVTCGTSAKSIFADEEQGLIVKEAPFDF